MPKKPSPKSGTTGPATVAARTWARARELILAGRVAEARRLLQALARVKGPYQARARAMLIRLASPALKRRSLKRAPMRMGRNPMTGEPVRVKRAVRVKKARAPRREKKPAPVKQPDTIKRIPHMNLPDRALKPGDSFTVDVYVDTKQARTGESSTALELERKAKQVIYDVDVWMAGSSHFIIEAPKSQVLRIDVRQDASKKVPFKVRVADKIEDPTGAVLFAYFSYKSRPSGQVSRPVKLAGGGEETPPPTKPPADSLVLTPKAPSADITVEVTDPKRTLQHMTANVTSTLVKPAQLAGPKEWDLTLRSDLMVRGYMKEFTDKSNIAALSLIGAGTRLFKAAPEAFKTLLWDLIDADTPPQTILISSEEPNIPWELMVPWRVDGDGNEETRKALGVEFKVGRWISGDHRSPPHVVPLKDSFIIAPTYVTEPMPLKKSAEEVALVRKAVPGPEVKPATLANIRKQMNEGGRSLVHFVCHGADAEEGSEIQAIFLDRGKERLTSLAVTAIPEVKQAFKKRPLVFLNACEVGRPTVALTGIGGFAAAFLDLGAAAVIAPLWSVRDTIAYEVARMFYAGAMAGRGFADIMREIRALAYVEETGEDTYAAYCFYGDPNASAA